MPVVTLNVGSTEAGRTAGGLTCLQWSDNGRSLFVGTESGRVLVVEMKAELVEIREEGYAMMNRLVEELVQELNSALYRVCLTQSGGIFRGIDRGIAAALRAIVQRIV